MYYVYILQSLKFPTRRYVGFTSNLEARLKTHNSKGSSFTSKYTPWEIVTYICFQNKELALDFERYLKTGSGIAFLKKRFITL